MEEEGKRESPLKVRRKQKELSEIFQEELETGIQQYERPAKHLFISSFAAGLEIGFSLFLMGLFYSLFEYQISPAAMELILAASYPLGFIFVVLGRSELFTEHTALAVIPVLNRQIQAKRLAGLWALIYSGNLLGGFIFSFVLVWLGPEMGILQKETFVTLSQKMVGYDWEIVLGSGILAGWLMGLLSWLVSAAEETTGRILIVFLVTATIGLGGLHHSIIGSIEIFCGMLISPSITFWEYLRVQWWATLGNSIGGVVFVAVLKFSHSKGS